MNKQMKTHLEAVVEAIIFDDGAAAKDAFHNYLSLKTQAILVGESTDEEGDEKDEKKDEPKSDDESDDKKEEKKVDDEAKDKGEKTVKKAKNKKDEGDEE